MNRFIVTAAAAVVSLSLFGGAGRAAFIAYDNAAVQANQDFGHSLGLDFNVGATPIAVTALGTFDSGNPAALSGVVGGGVTVAIFNRTTQTQFGPSVTFTPTNAGTPINGDAFLATDFELPAGFQGSIVAYNDNNYNSGGGTNGTSTENGGGLLSFVGGGRFDFSNSLDYPTIVDGGPTNRYDAGTFQFTAAPAPSSFVLAGMGVFCLAAFGLRRRVRGVA
jgi:hypothetical protein